MCSKNLGGLHQNKVNEALLLYKNKVKGKFEVRGCISDGFGNVQSKLINPMSLHTWDIILLSSLELVWASASAVNFRNNILYKPECKPLPA